MGISHTLSTNANLIAGTTLTQVIAAFTPLMEYFGYDGATPFAGEETFGDHSFTFDADIGQLSVYTNGDVKYDFIELVSEVAEALGPLTSTPSHFEFRDYDTADLDSAIRVVYFGPSKEAIALYEFNRVLEQALDQLSVHLNENAIQHIRELTIFAYQAATNGNHIMSTSCAVSEINILLKRAARVYSKLPDIDRHRIDIVHDVDACLRSFLQRCNQVAEEVFDSLSNQISNESIRTAK